MGLQELDRDQAISACNNYRVDTLNLTNSKYFSYGLVALWALSVATHYRQRAAKTQ
jgi:hypothetical protein